LLIDFWVLLANLCEKLFGFWLKIRANAEEIDCLDEANIGKEDTKVGYVENFPELFSRNQGNKLSL
jgi:hypothetical protein